MPRDGYRAVGVVERPRGLKGELKALPLTDFPERFAAGARVYIAAEERTVSRATWQKGRVYFYCHGIDDRETAEQLRNELLPIAEDDARWLARIHGTKDAALPTTDALPALARFLDHVQAQEKVWVARRIDIARHWQQRHPANP